MKWLISAKIKAKTPSERQSAIIKTLLSNRGLKTPTQIKQFLHPAPPEKLTAAQVGLSAVQLKKAVKRVALALKNKEKIIVYGDYDTDGVCATAIVWEALEKLGAAALPFIPARSEGYGLNSDRLDKMAADQVSLVITVDQGIVQNRQVAHARKAGIDIIVTDHHQPGKTLPNAHAIVHTTQLAGAGVAWFFAKELCEHLGPIRRVGPLRSFGLDLATIGTITDMVPLLGPNRSIVYHGIPAVKKTHRVGLLALFQTAAILPEKIGTYEIGYLIGPRLNASGRMEDPMDALRLVCTRDQKKAFFLAQKIDASNRDRQLLTEELVNHARRQWLEADGQSPLIFVEHESYQEGVVGLVASRLMEEFYRPVVVLSKGVEWSKASARSIRDFNIIEAVRACAQDLGAHGGHPGAAGFSVETTKIALVRERLIALAQKGLDPSKLEPTLKIDAEINPEDAAPALYHRLEEFAPFGMENPTPTFSSRGVKIVSVRPVGRDAKHLKLALALLPSRPLAVSAIAFNFGHLQSKIKPGDKIDIAYQLLMNEWNGERQLQLKVKDIITNLSFQPS